MCENIHNIHVYHILLKLHVFPLYEIINLFYGKKIKERKNI